MVVSKPAEEDDVVRWVVGGRVKLVRTVASFKEVGRFGIKGSNEGSKRYYKAMSARRCELFLGVRSVGFWSSW